MTTARATITAALAATCLALPMHATACGSAFVLGDEVGAAHPASLGVAFAMLDARNAGTLAPASTSPPTSAPTSVPTSARADPRTSADAAAHMLAQRLASVRDMPAVSMLLVESRLWTRYAPSARPRSDDAHDGAHEGSHDGSHDGGPADGDVVIVTGEAVLRGLLAGSISWSRAVDSGLVALAGDPARQARVAALLTARFAQPGADAMASRALPARF